MSSQSTSAKQMAKQAYRKARSSYTQVKKEYPAFDKVVGQNVHRAKKRIQAYMPAQPRRVPRLSPIQRSEEVDVLAMSLVRGLEPMHEGLVDLVSGLERSGIRTKLIARDGEAFEYLHPQLGDAVMDSPFSVVMAGRGLPKAPEANSLPSQEEIDAIILEDRGFRKKDLTEPIAEWERRFVTAFYNYWNAYLRRSQVKVLLTWGDTSSISALLIRLAKHIGIEHYVLERANFPGTLYLDPLGQYGNGLRQRTLAHYSAREEDSDAVERRFEEISTWYWGLSEIVETTASGHEEIQQLQQIKDEGRQIITIFGGNDYGSGLRVGPKHRLSWVESSRWVYDYLHTIVAEKFPDAYVVYRPHPSDRDYPEPDEHGQVALDANMHQLIELSDVCMNVSTTSHAIALLQGKPSITLGPTDALGYGEQNTILDKTMILPILRQILWGEVTGTEQNQQIIVDMFDHWVIGAEDHVPARLTTEHVRDLLFRRVSLWRSKYSLAMPHRERGISGVMCHEVMARQRKVFTNTEAEDAEYNGLTVIIPVYGDYEGTKRCIEAAVAHQPANGYQILIVWDCGPDISLRDLVREYRDTPHVTVIENKHNVGFSGTVNSAIMKSAPDDIILLNSDAVVSTDWAARLQRTAYADPKLATVVPFSNNATAWNVPFPDGQPLPQQNTLQWVQDFDDRAKENGSTAVEMPTNHGFCLFVKRNVIDRIGLFDELKFGVGQSEDNEFAMRLRANGYYTGCAVNVFVGHDGSTSFADWDQWRSHGRQVLTEEFSHYIKEVRHFYARDPLAQYRDVVLGDDPQIQPWPVDDEPEVSMIENVSAEDDPEAEDVDELIETAGLVEEADPEADLEIEELGDTTDDGEPDQKPTA